MALTSRQVRYLRSLAHHLKPVVQVGSGGVSEALIAKVDAELTNHELIKVKIAGNDRDEREEAADQVSEQTGAALVQSIGKTIVLYRARKKKPTIKLPKAEPVDTLDDSDDEDDEDDDLDLDADDLDDDDLDDDDDDDDDLDLDDDDDE